MSSMLYVRVSEATRLSCGIVVARRTLTIAIEFRGAA